VESGVEKVLISAWPRAQPDVIQVLSDRFVHLTSREDIKVLGSGRDAQGSAEEKVEFVTAHAIQKCVFPLK
jgi:hypothetical protein